MVSRVKKVRKAPKGISRFKRSGKPGSKKKCALCGSVLHGVPNRTKPGLRKLSKTRKRPERVFAGVLCASCVERVLKEKTRLKAGFLKRADSPLTILKYADKLSTR